MEKGLIFTYVLTYGGAVASLFNPFYGLLIYFCFAIVKPEALWHWSVPVGNYSRIIGIALLLGWALQGFGNWDLRRSRPIVFILLGYFFWMILSAANAQISPTTAWGEVEAFAKILLPFLAGVTLIDSVAKIRLTAWVMVLSQGFVALQMNQTYYKNASFISAMEEFGGMDNNSISIAMVCGAGLAFFLAMGETQWWKKLLCFACAVLMVHVPMFSMSRGGQLAILITGVVSFFLIPKQPKHYAVFAAAVIGALMLAGPEVRERFSSVFVDAEERDASADSRIELWKDCAEVMQDKPLFGVGPAHWPLVASDFGWPHGKAAHSVWFETGADLGVPGMALLLAFYLVTMWMMWKLARQPPLAEPWFADAGRMTVAAIVGFGVAASFVSLDALELPYYVVMLGACSLKLSSFYEGSYQRPAVSYQRSAISNQPRATIPHPTR